MIKHNIEEEAKLMALPEGTSVTVDGVTYSCILTTLRISNKYLKLYMIISWSILTLMKTTVKKESWRKVYDACEKIQSYNGEGN
jgi:hypothetical protein